MKNIKLGKMKENGKEESKQQILRTSNNKNDDNPKAKNTCNNSIEGMGRNPEKKRLRFE